MPVRRARLRGAVCSNRCCAGCVSCVDAADRWTLSADANTDDPLRGSADPCRRTASNDLALTGWVTAHWTPSAGGGCAQRLPRFGGERAELAGDGAAWLVAHRRSADRRRRRADRSRFRVSVPLNRLPPGAEPDQPGRALGTARHMATAVQVIVPRSGSDSDGRPARSAPLPAPLEAPVQPSQAGSAVAAAGQPDVPRRFTVQVLAPGADRSTDLDRAETAAVDWLGSTVQAPQHRRIPAVELLQVNVSAQRASRVIYVHAHFASGSRARHAALTVDYPVSEGIHTAAGRAGRATRPGRYAARLVRHVSA